MARPPSRPGTDRPVSVDALDDFVDRVAGFLDVPRYGLQHSWRPSIDVFREPEGLAVVAELPGVEQADVQVSVEDNRLRIAGIRRPPVLEGSDPLRLEIDYGPFERCVSLPADSDGEAITAQLHHGLLTVHVPRRAPARPVVVRVLPHGDSTNE